MSHASDVFSRLGVFADIGDYWGDWASLSIVREWAEHAVPRHQERRRFSIRFCSSLSALCPTFCAAPGLPSQPYEVGSFSCTQ